MAVLKTQSRPLGIIGSHNIWVFPAPASNGEPCSRFLAREWWERSARIAQLPIGERYAWHAVRRGWASEMRAVNPKDLCDLGGWATYQVPFKHYIQPNLEAQREAFTKRRELHEPTKFQSSHDEQRALERWRYWHPQLAPPRDSRNKTKRRSEGISPRHLHLGKWAREELNLRPHAYQACALTT